MQGAAVGIEGEEQVARTRFEGHATAHTQGPPLDCSPGEADLDTTCGSGDGDLDLATYAVLVFPVQENPACPQDQRTLAPVVYNTPHPSFTLAAGEECLVGIGYVALLDSATAAAGGWRMMQSDSLTVSTDVVLTEI